MSTTQTQSPTKTFQTLEDNVITPIDGPVIKYIMIMNFKDFIKSGNNSFKLLAIAVVLLIILFAIGYLSLSNTGKIFKNTQGNVLNLKPGVSSTSDVKETLGKPDAIKETKNGSEYIYKTTNGFEDTVIVKDNTVQSAQENIFNDNLGFLQDYINKYGEPDIALSDTSDESITWNIFLNSGVAIATFGEAGEIAKIIRFNPQSKNEFLATTAKNYGMIEEAEVNIEESVHELQIPQNQVTPEP